MLCKNAGVVDCLVVGNFVSACTPYAVPTREYGTFAAFSGIPNHLLSLPDRAGLPQRQSALLLLLALIAGAMNGAYLNLLGAIERNYLGAAWHAGT